MVGKRKIQLPYVEAIYTGNPLHFGKVQTSLGPRAGIESVAQIINLRQHGLLPLGMDTSLM
jgi:hypothetical protein